MASFLDGCTAFCSGTGGSGSSKGLSAVLIVEKESPLPCIIGAEMMALRTFQGEFARNQGKVSQNTLNCSISIYRLNAHYST